MNTAFLCLMIICIISPALGDTIANCTFESAAKVLTFIEGSRDHNSSIVNSACGVGHRRSTIRLTYPNIAVDDLGHIGTWTMVYNQGFEVTINYRKYFGFFSVTNDDYNCKLTSGFAHDVYVRDWSCAMTQDNSVSSDPVIPNPGLRKRNQQQTASQNSPTYHNDAGFIGAVNKVATTWRAAAYPEHEGVSHTDLVRKMGGPKSRVFGRPQTKAPSANEMRQAAMLPASFDWRNVNGQNFVSPIRNQAKCGSCYSFASMAMLEARYRIATNNTQKPVFSPQNIVSCSDYSQGCEGGFSYLIAGKYAEDFGVVSEDCYPYIGNDTATCAPTKTDCTRYYATDYHYVGGYYGACSEALMKIALVRNGPLAVGFEVYDDFMHYQSGVYRHTGLHDTANNLNTFNPFQLTNHAVLVVGYGSDPSGGGDYWIVKNSWGPDWGENGFFRIARGNDECGIESMAMESFPIVK